MNVKRKLGNLKFRMEDALGRFRLPRVSEVAATPLAVLMYHGISNDPERIACSKGMDIAPEACLAEIRFFMRQGYQPISPSDLFNLSRRGGVRGYLLVTFDDGHRNALEFMKFLMRIQQVPVLMALCPAVVERDSLYWWEELRARFFLTMAFPIRFEHGGIFYSFDPKKPEVAEQAYWTQVPSQGREFMARLREATDDVSDEMVRRSLHVHENMGWDELRELVRHPLCSIAAHSMHHDLAVRMSHGELVSDAQRCRHAIERELSKSCVDYVYPNGMHSDDTERALRSCGYSRTYTTEGRLNFGAETQLLHRFRGDGLSGSLHYYGAIWKSRHESRRLSAG